MPAAKSLLNRLAVVAALLSAQTPSVLEAGPQLDSRIAQVLKASGATVAGQRARSPELLDEFYGQAGYGAVWVDERGLTTNGLALVGVLGGARAHGLDARDYHLPTISARIAELREGDVEGSAALELLMTDGALTYARHLSRGKVSPEILYDQWKARPRKQDVVAAVKAALVGGADGMEAAFDALAPRDPRYRQLKALLIQLDDLGALFLEFLDGSAGVSLVESDCFSGRCLGSVPQNSLMLF